MGHSAPGTGEQAVPRAAYPGQRALGGIGKGGMCGCGGGHGANWEWWPRAQP